MTNDASHMLRGQPGNPGQFAGSIKAEGDTDLGDSTAPAREARYTAAVDVLVAYHGCRAEIAGNLIDFVGDPRSANGRYLLVEDDRAGNLYPGFFDTVADAQHYQQHEQEYPEDFTPHIYDLDTGEAFESFADAQQTEHSVDNYPVTQTDNLDDGKTVTLSYGHPDSLHHERAVDMLSAALRNGGADIVEAIPLNETSSTVLEGVTARTNGAVSAEYVNRTVQIKLPGYHRPLYVTIECPTDDAFA